MSYNESMRFVLPLLALLLVACSNPKYALNGSRIQSSRLFDKPILLTIDDGPRDAAVDAQILAVLRQHGAKAVWFVNCQNFDSASPHATENMATLKRIAAGGHEIGSHGYAHIHLDRANAASLDHEITGCSKAIAGVVGHRPRLYRPAWGVSSPAADAVIRANAMQSVLWDLNSYDSMLSAFKTQPGAYAAFLRKQDIAASADAGDVLLLHDYPQTARNLDRLLTSLEERRFHFVLPN